MKIHIAAVILLVDPEYLSIIKTENVRGGNPAMGEDLLFK
jgi:hypothetical protein